MGHNAHHHQHMNHHHQTFSSLFSPHPHQCLHRSMLSKHRTMSRTLRTKISPEEKQANPFMSFRSKIIKHKSFPQEAPQTWGIFFSRKPTTFTPRSSSVHRVIRYLA